VVSKNLHTVSAYSADGRLMVQYPATMRSQHDPLPLGDWKVADVQQNPVFRFNPQFFWDAKPRDQKALIPAGPRNPVGVVWIGLTKEHYGIHGTAAPSTIGHTESHGCIRLTNWDAEELSKMVKPGTPVILQE
jgi:lipoprotein-anchoring transpeptidase ErfK/SrfK